MPNTYTQIHTLKYHKICIFKTSSHLPRNAAKQKDIRETGSAKKKIINKSCPTWSMAYQPYLNVTLFIMSAFPAQVLDYYDVFLI